MLILKTFDDVLAVMGRAGGFIKGNLTLADSRVVSLTANEVDPEIELEICEETVRALPTSPHELSNEELLRRLADAPGSLG